MERRCPDAVLKAAALPCAASLPLSGIDGPAADSTGAEGGPGDSRAGVPPARGGSESGKGSGEGMRVPGPELVGYATALDRLRRMEATLGEAYAAAIQKGEDDRAERLRRQWGDVTEQLRKAEISSMELRRKGERAGGEEMIPVSRACEVLDKIHKCIPRRVLSDLQASYGDVLRAVNAGPDSWREWAAGFVNGAFQRLSEARFADAVACVEGVAPAA